MLDLGTVFKTKRIREIVVESFEGGWIQTEVSVWRKMIAYLHLCTNIWRLLREFQV